jgi:hypothetical protein
MQGGSESCTILKWSYTLCVLEQTTSEGIIMRVEYIDGEYSFSDGNTRYPLDGAIMAASNGNTGIAVYKREYGEDMQQYPYKVEGYYLPSCTRAGGDWLTAKEFAQIKRDGIENCISPDM